MQTAYDARTQDRIAPSCLEQELAMLPARAGILGSLLLLAACAANGGGGAIEFRGEQSFLDTLSYDTGYVPEVSPASVRVVVAGGGSIIAEASADSDGSTMTPRAESGRLRTMGQLTLDVFARVDVAGVSYEGEVESLGYAIEPAMVTFDPFLLGESIGVTTSLPPAELGSFPIPSVPGSSLVLRVTGGSLDTTFEGVCATTHGENGQYTGATTVDGMIEMSASIVIAIPVTGDREFGPFDFTVPVPPLSNAIDLGTRSLSDGSEITTGPFPCDVAVSDGGMSDGSMSDATVVGRDANATPDAGPTGRDASVDSGGGCGPECPAGSICTAGECTYRTQSCPSGTVAVGFDPASEIVCAPLDAHARDAVNDNCEVYFGWSDACDAACMAAPEKWGSTSPGSCRNTGADGTCATYTLGGASVRMYGLSPDGSVDNNDRFNIGFRCQPLLETEDTASRSCPAGSFLAGINTDGSLNCRGAERAIVEYANERCSTYFGWRDECDGCLEPPFKSGRANDLSCRVLGGADSNCSVHDLDGDSVRMYGLSPDGRVDGNDTFFSSLTCIDAPPSSPTARSVCLPRELAIGVEPDGRVRCAAVAGIVDNSLRTGCSLYLGWRDSCDGCTSVPTKWARSSGANCSRGAGLDNTCNSYTIAGETTSLSGLNMDGNVDGNDKLYIGFLCQ